MEEILIKQFYLIQPTNEFVKNKIDELTEQVKEEHKDKEINIKCINSFLTRNSTYPFCFITFIINDKAKNTNEKQKEIIVKYVEFTSLDETNINNSINNTKKELEAEHGTINFVASFVSNMHLLLQFLVFSKEV